MNDSLNDNFLNLTEIPDTKTDAIEPQPLINRLERKSNDQVSRRGFFRRGAQVIGALALGTVFPSSKQEQTDSDEVLDNNDTLIIDFFDTDSFYKRTLESQSIDDDKAKAILSEIGVTDGNSLDGLKLGVPKTPEQELVFLLSVLNTYYSNHGNEVADVHQKATKYVGNKGKKVNKMTIVDGITYDSITHDELGNPILWVNISQNKVNSIITASKNSNINLSMEMGKVGIQYDLYEKKAKYPEASKETPGRSSSVESKTGKVMNESFTDSNNNPITKEEYDAIIERINAFEIKLQNVNSRDFWPQDGYLRDRAYENLSHLASVAKMHPKRVFVAAAGNPSALSADAIPDISEAKERLINEGEWPDNIFTVGVYLHDQIDFPTSYGADIYVGSEDLKNNFGVDGFASFATPTIEAVISEIKSKGITEPDKMRKALFELTDLLDLGNDQIRLLNFDKIRDLQYHHYFKRL